MFKVQGRKSGIPENIRKNFRMPGKKKSRKFKLQEKKLGMSENIRENSLIPGKIGMARKKTPES